MIEIVDYPGRFVTRAAAKTLTERTLARIRRRWQTIESAIAGDPWLDARGPTTADLAIAVVSRWSTGKRWRQQNCPGIEGIAAAVSNHESTRAVWESHFGG